MQLLIHLWGDYLTQSDWMAQNKTKAHLPAAIHALIYSLGFALLRPSLAAFAVICGTHFLIDRYRLARYVVWAKNWVGPKQFWGHPGTDEDPSSAWAWHGRTPPFRFCTTTGYPPTAPPWLAFWLLIIADNTLHLTINFFALKYL